MSDSSFDDEMPLPRRERDQPTNAGVYAGIAALVGLGLLGIIAVLWYMMTREDMPTARLLIWWLVILDGVAFGAGLTALMLGLRAQARDNPHYRGVGLAGLIGGVILLVGTTVIGLVLFCCGLFLQLIQLPGG